VYTYTAKCGYRWGLTEEWIDGVVRVGLGERTRELNASFTSLLRKLETTHTNVAYTDLGSSE
jgi:hypothetical protein